MPNIFEPLYSTKSFGVGLGMSIVNQIMKQHKGGVEVHSAQGNGTTIILWLPSQIGNIDVEGSEGVLDANSQFYA